MDNNMKILHGNNIELLKSIPDNSIDAVVTDPPYGLGKEPNAEFLMQDWIAKGYHEVKGSGFMGKEWDAFVPQPIFWKEVFRVLKHGGHVVSFFGTRTYDWGVMAMRFAGFEVRDCLQWLYGSGFPKSHNISKAIDKLPKANDRLIEFSELLKSRRNDLKLTISEADDLICDGSTMYHFLEGRNVNGVFKIYPPNKEMYEKLKLKFQINGWDDIVENNLELIGSEVGNFGFQQNGERWLEQREIKKATTEQAKYWNGWGTALKPANEPIVLARKPLEKGLSIAENVLKYGTGGINIDGCRVGTEERSYKGMSANIPSGAGTFRDDNWTPKDIEVNVSGRFPANVILTHHPDCECVGTKKVGKGERKNHDDGEVSNANEGYKRPNKSSYTHKDSSVIANYGEETIEDWNCHEDCPIKILDEQSGVLKSGDMKGEYQAFGKNGIYGGIKTIQEQVSYGDKGGASRFFYVAKASQKERNKGLEDFEKKPLAFSNQAKAELARGNTEFADETKMHNKVQFRANNHPTIKPIKLMQYLVRLVTPPNGVVLDPFMGSGTTGIACKLEGFDFVGMEQDENYHKIAQARIENYVDEEQVKKQEKQDNEPKVKQAEIF
jgi:DNA modification methylase